MSNEIYYSIVNRSTGIMEFGRSNYINHTERPLHPSLAYAPLNNELVRLLVPDDSADHEDLNPVDFTKTYWDFVNAQWVIFYDVPNKPGVDPLEQALLKKQTILELAQKRAAMEDISPAYQQILNDFIAEVTAIDITEENVQETVTLIPDTIPN